MTLTAHRDAILRFATLALTALAVDLELARYLLARRQGRLPIVRGVVLRLLIGGIGILLLPLS